MTNTSNKRIRPDGKLKKKPVARNKDRIARERREAVSLLIDAALDRGLTTKQDIAEGCNIKLWEVSDAFKYNRELYAKFCVCRKTIVDMAADNLQKILQSPHHPQHFAATKYILQTYKSDLDENLENKSDKEVSVTVPTESNRRPVVISFKK